MPGIVGSLTAPGSVTLTTHNGFDTSCIAAVNGASYTTLQFVFEGTVDGTNWFALAAMRYDTYGVVTGTIAPSNDSENCWFMQASGLTQVRARATNIAAGTATFTLISGSFVGNPINISNNTITTLTATSFTGDVTLSDVNLVLGTATGTKIGTSTLQKLAFWNSTPIVQPVNTTDLYTVLVNTGLIATGGTPPFSPPGNVTMADAKNVILNTTTGTKIGTTTLQKLSFFNATPVVQPVANTDTTTGAAGSVTNVFLNTTFTGAGTAAYTIGGICGALKQLGILAT
jgi:hypothetical protein